MAHLKLNCPQCRKQLDHVPLEGLTLYYRCDVHGAFILRPLVLLESETLDRWSAAWPQPDHHSRPSAR